MLSTADILAAIPDALLRVDLTGLGPRQEGKVRDIYVHHGKRFLNCGAKYSRWRWRSLAVDKRWLAAPG